MSRRAILAVVALAALTAPAVQAAETTQKFGFNPEQFEIKFYIQPRYAYFAEPDREVDNTFSVRRTRVYLTSKVTPSLTGRIQFEVKPEKTEALDVYFIWANPPEKGLPVALEVGQFKKPISYQEFVMGSNNLNLIDRPFTNAFLEKNLVVSSRDQGAMGSLDLWEKDMPALLYFGVFNGNGLNKKEDDNSGKEFVARADVTPVSGLSLGVNGAVNHVTRADTTGTFTVWGGDLVFEKKGFQAVAEVFSGENYEGVLTKAVSPDAEVDDFLGWYAEAIYRFANGWEPAARFESFDPDTDVDDDERSILTGQIAKSFSANFRWQINAVHSSFAEDGRDAETEIVSQWTVRL